MEAEKKPNSGPQKTYQVGGSELTECHMRIISLNIRGLRRKEMAVVLKVASSTIDSHFNRIYREVKFHDARLLVVWALNNGFDGNGNYPGLRIENR
jgi:DNA-binding NarL/FixJ family response regulator